MRNLLFRFVLPPLTIRMSKYIGKENCPRQYFDKNGKEIKAGLEICPSEQEICTELEELAPIIEGTEVALDYGEKVSKEDYEKYEAAIARRTMLTSMLGEDSPAPEITCLSTPSSSSKRIRPCLRMSPIFSMISRKPPLLSKTLIGRTLRKPSPSLKIRYSASRPQARPLP